jgi:hypothetical protein
MMAFFRRALKHWRDANCARTRHLWKDEPVLSAAGKPTRMMVRRCSNCGAKYIWWKGE